MGKKEFDKTKKLLYTIYYRYGVLPNWVESWYDLGKLPIKTEKSIEQLILGRNFKGDFSQTIYYLNTAKDIVIKDINDPRYNQKALMRSGWIYKRLPKSISEFFSKKSKQ